MQKELTVTFWKEKGVPHLGLLHAKTGMSEALAKYADAEKKGIGPDAKAAREAALKKIKEVLVNMKKNHPEPKNPKLWSNFIKACDMAVKMEVTNYNAAIDSMKISGKPEEFSKLMSMSIVGKALWEFCRDCFTTRFRCRKPLLAKG